MILPKTDNRDKHLEFNAECISFFEDRDNLTKLHLVRKIPYWENLFITWNDCEQIWVQSFSNLLGLLLGPKDLPHVENFIISEISTGTEGAPKNENSTGDLMDFGIFLELLHDFQKPRKQHYSHSNSMLLSFIVTYSLAAWEYDLHAVLHGDTVPFAIEIWNFYFRTRIENMHWKRTYQNTSLKTSQSRQTGWNMVAYTFNCREILSNVMKS